MLRRSLDPGWSHGTRRSGPGRPGFTLLEVILAATIAVLLLSALYAAVRVQVNHVQAGREVVGQSTLARQILRRIDSDIRAAVALADPARFRLANSQSSSSSGSGSSSSSSGSGTTSGTSSTNSGSGTSSTNNSSGSTDSSNSSSSSTTTTTSSFTLPFGVQGDSSSLNLFVSKLPREVLFGMPDGSTPPVFGDIRRISYWLAGGGGLARLEVKLETSPDMANPSSGGPDEASSVEAPEVQNLSFRYFDGSSWQSSWDSTMLGDDGLTPIGPPRLIEITIALTHSSANPGGRRGLPQTKTYRHVVAIPTANGTQELANGALQQSNTNPQPAGTTQTSGGGTSP